MFRYTVFLKCSFATVYYNKLYKNITKSYYDIILFVNCNITENVIILFIARRQTV